MSTWKTIFNNHYNEWLIEITCNGIKSEWLKIHLKASPLAAYIKNAYNFSQKDIDEMLEELAKKLQSQPTSIQAVPQGQFNFSPTTYAPQSIQYIPDSQLDFGIKTEHKHEWIMYTGLIEQFEHCKTCGEKKK